MRKSVSCTEGSVEPLEWGLATIDRLHATFQIMMVKRLRQVKISRTGAKIAVPVL
jgi:hypothetical protein